MIKTEKLKGKKNADVVKTDKFRTNRSNNYYGLVKITDRRRHKPI